MSELCKDILTFVTRVALTVMIVLAVSRIYPQKQPVLIQKERVDTLVIFDTIVSEKPVFVEKKVIEKILVPVTDTMWVTDTLYMWMDKEQIHWSDDWSDVYASGMQVQVDSVIHHIPTQVITKETQVAVKEKTKWGIGIHAGYGAFVQHGQIAASPYIGVGVSYNLSSW